MPTYNYPGHSRSPFANAPSHSTVYRLAVKFRHRSIALVFALHLQHLKPADWAESQNMCLYKCTSVSFPLTYMKTSTAVLGTITNTHKTNLTTLTSLASMLSPSFYSNFNIFSSHSGIQIARPRSTPLAYCPILHVLSQPVQYTQLDKFCPQSKWFN